MRTSRFIIKTLVSSNAIILIALLITLANGCKEDDEPAPLAETGTVTDVDGNIYKTIKIGNQWWMAEDLKVSKYRNGNSILKIQSDTALWSHDTTGAYCDNIDNTSTIIGKLYNWYAVSNADQIAPAGWHIPSDDEWKALEMHLGMSPSEADNVKWHGTNEGDKLKIEGPQGWTKFEEVWGNNQSGFTALASGCRLFDGRPGDPGLFATGFWWSSSERSATNEAWYRYLDYKNSNVFRAYSHKNYGFSVRCVKD